MQNSTPQISFEYPEFLYHYTTVESLAMILKTRSIRLAPLTGLDDVQESKSAELHNFARFVFVSSWTEDGNESIPMWNMYAKMDRGVRIKLPAMPIADFEVTPDDLAPFGKVENFENTKLRFIVPARKLLSMNYIPLPYTKEGLLHKVEYTSEKSLLEPKIYIEEGDMIRLEMGKLGLYKNEHWGFQKEWRFKVWINPISFLEAIKLNPRSGQIALSRMKNDLLPLPTTSFFLTIDDQAFSQMEVTLNPKISDGSRTIVELLKKEFNPSMSVIDSVLTNTIR